MTDNESLLSGSSSTAMQTWEASNNIDQVESVDAIYKYDSESQKEMLSGKPWKNNPHYFKKCKISALALLKMTMHARSGGTIEVMGVMTGKIDGDTMIVMDSYALPVEGTETRVNAGDEANEYMIQYLETLKKVGKQENLIGWYHSHPGYGCWLSGIDVSTQLLQQTWQDPFLAVVVDPTRTISAGKVEIGAFRTYPKGYKPEDDSQSEYQSVPMEKIEDFGVHCKSYYSLEISYFKSALDKRILENLWNKYWVSTLSTSTLLTNQDYMTGQISDLAKKLESAKSSLSKSHQSVMIIEKQNNDDKLGKAFQDCQKLANEASKGLISQITKQKLFSMS